jgi:transcription-repair coupling factor (superfamily II helicase)
VNVELGGHREDKNRSLGESSQAFQNLADRFGLLPEPTKTLFAITALEFFRKMDEPAKRVAQVETAVGLLTG